MEDFSYLIISPYYYEYLAIEIYFKNNLIAEINQEHKQLEIELFHLKENLHIPFDDFYKAIEKAKKHLLSDQKKRLI